jgi:trigger factor
MNYTQEKLKNQVRFTVTISKEEWEEANRQAYLKNKGKYFVQGFRKGHVPRKILESIYGKGVFYEEALNIAVPKYYSEILEREKDVFPVEAPDIDIKEIDGEGGCITFTATVNVKPEVKLGDYKAIKVKKPEYNVTDEDVEKELKAAQNRASRLVDVEGRPAEKGDIVTIDYSGTIGGKKFEGGTAEKQSVELGSGRFVPGFEEQLVGMSCGEEKDITVRFPDDYHKELAGKEAVFKVKLHEIKRKELPELNDEFAKDVSEFDTFEEYKADIRKKLEQSNEKRAEAELENRLLEAVAEASEVDISQVMIENQIDSMVQDLTYRLMYQGMKLEDYLKYTGQSPEQLKASYKEGAEKAVKSRLVLEQLIKQEKIEATQEDLDARIKELAERAKKSPEEYSKDMGEDTLSYLKNEIVMEKAFSVLKANAVLE